VNDLELLFDHFEHINGTIVSQQMMDEYDSEIPWRVKAYVIDAPEAVKYFLCSILSE